ncbi:MAG: hypothetical protein IPO27_18050 [Bacteroidetes bacterium]|nr:hypothetical protein [Bacteroidota bacterium]
MLKKIHLLIIGSLLLISCSTQAEGLNPQLDIRCNTYKNHEAHAWAVLEKNNIGVLNDQGDGNQPNDNRPQNTFDVFNICTNAEAHFYAEYDFKYYVNNFNNGNPPFGDLPF